jgi:hypothetical protein
MEVSMIRSLIPIALLSLFASCPASAQGCSIDFLRNVLICDLEVAPSSTVERSLKLQNDALSLQNSTTVDRSGGRTAVDNSIDVCIEAIERCDEEPF